MTDPTVIAGRADALGDRAEKRFGRWCYYVCAMQGCNHTFRQRERARSISDMFMAGVCHTCWIEKGRHD